jgi:hypothetical protein
MATAVNAQKTKTRIIKPENIKGSNNMEGMGGA